MRVHEGVQVGIIVSCSPAQARHEGKKGQEAQQSQQQQQPRPLEQGQRPFTRPVPAPGGTRGKSDQAPSPWWPCGLEKSPEHDTHLLAPAPPFLSLTQFKCAMGKIIPVPARYKGDCAA